MSSAQRHMPQLLSGCICLHRAMVGAALAVAVIAYGVGGSERERSLPSGSQATLPNLPLEETVSGTLSGDTSAAYKMQFQAGQLARFQIHQIGNGLIFAVRTPSLQPALDLLCAEDGAQVVSMIAQSSGVYEIQFYCRLTRDSPRRIRSN